MSTTPQIEVSQADQIQALLERIAKAESFKAGAMHRVCTEAKKYAMMKTFGCYMEPNGSGVDTKISVGASSRESYTQMFAENVLRYAVDALAESSIGF